MNNANVIDYYAVLGVPRDATADQIESKWREIQGRYHPDQYQGLPELVAMLASQKLRQIDAAAEVLLDAARRAELDESLRKAEQRSAPAKPASVPVSLDFGHIGPAQSLPGPSSSSGPASVAPLRKAAGSRGRDKAGGSRRAAVVILVMIAIALIVAFAATKRSSKELVTSSPSAKPAYQSPPAPKPPPAYTPSPKVHTPPPRASAPPAPASTPPPATTPQSMPARAVPVEFMEAFQKYATQAGNKAIALALDRDGRFAHGSIAGYSSQPEANKEALSECMRYKAQSGIQENCRLFAVGDKVVW